MRICEVWKKGYPTRNQVATSVRNWMGNKAEVNIDQDLIEVKMYFHDFIDKFTQAGMFDKILTMHSKLEKYTFADRAEDGNINRMFSTLNQYFLKVYNIAIRNCRAFAPLGWFVHSNFSNYGIASANSIITITILRDFNEQATLKPDTTKLYHITRSKNLPDILQNGLKLGSNSRPSFHGYRNRIYLFNGDPREIDLDMVIHLVTGSIFRASRESLQINIALLEVELDMDKNTIYKDPEYTHGVYIENPVPPENINVVYKGTLGDFIK